MTYPPVNLTTLPNSSNVKDNACGGVSTYFPVGLPSGLAPEFIILAFYFSVILFVLSKTFVVNTPELVPLNTAVHQTLFGSKGSTRK